MKGSGGRLSSAVWEAWRAVTARPARSAMTALGTTVAVGAFVSTVGIGATGAAEISSRFDVLKATEVRLVDSVSNEDALPADIEVRLSQLNGIVAGGRFWRLDVDAADVNSIQNPRYRSGAGSVTVVAADLGALEAAHPTLAWGRVFSPVEMARSEHVALIGANAAQEVMLNPASGVASVFIEGVPFAIVGMIEDSDRLPELALSVVIPDSTADAVWTRQASHEEVVLIEVQTGAAQLVARQAPYALRPEDPASFEVLVAPEPETLRESVEIESLSLLFALLTISLVIGTLAIANATLVAVIERSQEIGLRRALGATTRDIVSQVMMESTFLGAAGGIAGLGLGLLAVAGVSIARGWTPAIPSLVILAPLVGAMSGLVAGLYPALRASKIEPIRALQS